MTSTGSLPDSALLALLEAEQERRRRARQYDWSLSGRPDQHLPEGDWRIWLVLAGRGWGKTRTGAEAVRSWSERFSRISLIAPTGDDAREIMVEGESGVLAVFPQDRPARYIANRRRIVFPSGSIGTIYSADEPDRLRGPQHTKVWADELAAWRYPEAWDMAMLGLRLGASPQAIITTTPKPTALVKELRNRSHLETDPLGRVILTRGSTYDNAANLAPAFLSEIVQRYEGTRLGRQELHAEILEEIEGALWTGAMIEAHRVREAPRMARVIVAVDPATTHGPESDETGITVGGRGEDGDLYVLASEGLRASPETWGSRVLSLYDEHYGAAIVAETNQGGEMVSAVLRAVCARTGRTLPRVITIHAKKAKVLRAEPVVAMYEQGRVHHVGVFPVLEEQQTSFPVATEHDDRVDATVYALTELAATKRSITAY
jgi:predicted phage terminase large subunit-like protein